VLAIDWSLEAPGLHHLLLPPGSAAECPGLLEMFLEASSLLSSEETPAGLMEKLQPSSRFPIASGIPGVDLLKAGRFDGGYFQSVAGFDWRGLDERAHWLIGTLIDDWRKHYRYILIDSRSGVNEMSGMCTMMIPDKLVLLFAPHRASLEGVADIARFAFEYRRSGESPRPLEILPVPSRVETLEPERAENWRYGTSGYQPLFENLLAELNETERCRLQAYFNEVELPYNPRYAFGEELAAVAERDAVRSPLTRGYTQLAARISSPSRPWEDPGESNDSNRIEVDGQWFEPAEAETRLMAKIPVCMGKRDNAGLASTLQKLALLESRAGRTTEARAYYQQALALLRAAGSKDQLASLMSAIGAFEHRAGNLEESIRSLSEALAMWREEGTTRRVSRTLELLAAAELDALRVESARGHFEELVELCRQDRDSLGTGLAYLKLGEIARNGDLAQARSHLDSAVGIFTAERDNRSLAACLRALAHVHLRAGNLEEAERSYEQCLEISRGAGDSSQRAQTLLGLANVDRKLRKYDVADQRYREALRLFDGCSDKPGLALALQRLAELELRSGRVEQAREHYSRAFDTLRETNDPRAMANVAMGLGDLARRSSNFEEAYKHYESAMELYRGLYNSLGQANALLNLGDLERRAGKLEQARERYHQAIQLFKPGNGRTGMANALKSLGDLEAQAEQLRLAREHYMDAVRLYKEDQNHLGLANAYQRLGDVERRRRNLTEAKRFYDEARELYSTENSATGLAYTYSELARVSHMLCDFGGSIAYLDQAISSASRTDVTSVQEYVWLVGAEIRGARN
jgi:tetratricopeptide (TPR) repeat protein